MYTHFTLSQEFFRKKGGGLGAGICRLFGSLDDGQQGKLKAPVLGSGPHSPLLPPLATCFHFLQ